MATPDFLSPTDTFIHRHLGPTDADAHEMLATLGLQSLEELSEAPGLLDFFFRRDDKLRFDDGKRARFESRIPLSLSRRRREGEPIRDDQTQPQAARR